MKLIYIAVATLMTTITVDGAGRYVREDECEACERQVATCLEEIGPLLKEDEPLQMRLTSGPCQLCDVTNVHTVHKGGRTCSTKKSDGSWEQDMPLEFDSIAALCDCEFPNAQGVNVAGKLDVLWNTAKMRTVLNINNNIAQVSKSEVDCETPGSTGCTIPKESVDIKCLFEDPDAKKNCEDQKESCGSNLLQTVAQTAFPGMATEKINKYDGFLDNLSCKEE